MTNLLLDAAAPVKPGPMGGGLSFLPVLIMFGALFYFMIYRPQKKRQKQAQELMSSLTVGSKIQTIGGFIGEVVEINGDEFVILSEESKFRIKKNAIAFRVDTPPELPADASEENDSKKDKDNDDDDFDIEDFEI